MASHAQNIPYRPTWSLYHHHSRCTSLTPFCSFIYLFHLVFAVLVGFYLLYIPSSRALVVYYSHDNVASLPDILHGSLPSSTYLYRYQLFVPSSLYVSSYMMRYLTYHGHTRPFPPWGRVRKGKEGREGGKGQAVLYVYIPKKFYPIKDRKF